MSKIYLLTVDSTLKTFSVVDGGVSVRYEKNEQFNGVELKEDDILLGLVTQGVNEFRSSYRVLSVDDDGIELEKEIERSSGVSVDTFMPQLSSALSGLLGGAEIVGIDQGVAEKIHSDLLGTSVAVSSVPEVDVLSVALKLFQRQRAGSGGLGSEPSANGGAERGGPNGWASYDAWAKAARETFAKVDAGMLIAADFDYAGFARKFVYNPTVANAFFKDHKEDDKREVGNFISQNRQTPKAASWYIEKDNLPKVKGLKSGVALNFMMKVRPAEFATYSPMIDKALMSVGLLAKPLPDEPTVESYEQSKALQGRVLAKMHELHIGKAADDESAADYLTVNEFAWWLSDEKNQNLIKEKVMESKMKDAAPTLMEDGKRKDLKFDPEKLDDILLLRLLASLRAKGFAILAGHSGTGKSRYVKKLAYMTCNVEELRKEGELPGNYLILQVKPNWHDSTELLGFRNAMDGNRYQKTSLIEFLFKAYHYKDTPFFLCLDEMNLAPVEQYFAEFLSAMESEEPVALNDIKADESNLFELGCEYKDAREYLSKNGFSIPKNLFIVGTVNMDETTNQFSRKVLDRAFTIEMTDVDFTKFGSVEKPSYSDTLKEPYVKELLGGVFAADKLDEDDTKEGSPLVKVQKALAETPFAIAYRFASEYTLLKRALAVFDDGEKKIGLDPFDQAALMKILPRIAGEADYIRKVYGEEGKDGLRKALEGKKVSLEKIKTILKRAKDTNAQYITFWP